MNFKEETSMDSGKPSMDSKKKQIVICPRPEAQVEFREGRFHLIQKIHGDPKESKCDLHTSSFNRLRVEDIHPAIRGPNCYLSRSNSLGTETEYVYYLNYYGIEHEECSKSAPIKHPLHPKHTLMFVFHDVTLRYDRLRRHCFCCAETLTAMFYWCPSCDFAINLAFVENKQTLIRIDHPKRHEHTLTLFPRVTTLTCNVCALDDSRIGSIYICPACDFVVHKMCIDLPWSIRISRHPQHRLSFTSSFSLGDLICNICRREINSDYGGYICNKDGCSYFAHSRCATGIIVWDGRELEGLPEEVEEEVKPPFEMLGDGIIRHFSHEQYPLKLNIEDSVYDESRVCQACIMPIYDGKFYSCTQDCSFILHEDCANLARRIYHALHPHPLLLLPTHPLEEIESPNAFHCSACGAFGSGFCYWCSRERCSLILHVQCATICEPLIHSSHVHPLFLTSALVEFRSCSICKDSESSRRFSTETFNCIESGCEFSLCYECVVLPQKVRYKHDAHFLSLSYGEETMHWCELCETKIKPGERFYTCDDYCCVTLHIDCLLLGRDMKYKLGSYVGDYDVIPNGMTRPICSNCNKRCKQKIVLQREGLKYCSSACLAESWWN